MLRPLPPISSNPRHPHLAGQGTCRRLSCCANVSLSLCHRLGRRRVCRDGPRLSYSSIGFSSPLWRRYIPRFMNFSRFSNSSTTTVVIAGASSAGFGASLLLDTTHILVTRGAYPKHVTIALSILFTDAMKAKAAPLTLVARRICCGSMTSDNPIHPRMAKNFTNRSPLECECVMCLVCNAVS